MKCGILGKLFVPIAIILLFVTGGGFYFAFDASKKSIDELLDAELAALGRLIARNVETFSDTTQNNLRALSHLTRIREFVRTEDPQSAPPMAAALASFVSDYDHYETVTLINKQGLVIGSSDNKSLDVSVADRNYFIQALAGKPTFSLPMISRYTNNSVFTMGYPVIIDNEVMAVLAVTIPLKEFSATMVDGIRVAKTGYPLIVGPDGTVVAHQDFAHIGKLQISDFDWGRKAMSLTDSSFHYTFNGIAKVGHVLHVPSVDWRVIMTLEESDAAMKTVGAMRASIIALILVLASLSLALLILIRRLVSKPLGIMAALADAVANGNLDTDMDGMAPEFANKGELTTTFNSMSRMLHALKENIALADQKSADAQQQTERAMEATARAEEAQRMAEKAKREGMYTAAEQLEEVINIISSASEQLSSQVELSNQGAVEQSSRTTEAATAMEEMNSTVSEVAKNASFASEMSANTRKKADDGVRIVHEVVTSIKNVQAQSVTLKEDMNLLVEHAQSINQIMGVISDIADQTNLLALNAAIEAARAGEAGRGFAVVADEVRKLAEKTMASTADVGNAIKSIQKSATKNMEQVDMTVQTIQTATGLADTSGSVLEEILAMSDNTADQVRSIATASEEQSATSEEINRSIGHVNTIASTTATAMREASRAVTELAAQAQQLQAMVVKMKAE